MKVERRRCAEGEYSRKIGGLTDRCQLCPPVGIPVDVLMLVLYESHSIPWLTLPAGYLGSSFMGAAMIACAFDIRASKIMTLVLAAVFLLTLWWARRDWL